MRTAFSSHGMALSPWRGTTNRPRDQGFKDYMSTRVTTPWILSEGSL